jgi:hypothetical protein
MGGVCFSVNKFIHLLPLSLLSSLPFDKPDDIIKDKLIKLFANNENININDILVYYYYRNLILLI